jgi:hypothetical protein
MQSRIPHDEDKFVKHWKAHINAIRRQIMKRACIAGLVALSLGISAQAMAKDADAIDILAGDFAGIASLDIDKLFANKMINDSVDQNQSALGEAEKALKFLKDIGVDYKKDIDLVTVAFTDKGNVCSAVDAKKAINALFDEQVKKNNLASADHNGNKIYTYQGSSLALLIDSRIVVCYKSLDIKPIIDNAKADKVKDLKSRDAALYQAYAKTTAGSDIRVAVKMTDALKKEVKDFKLDGEPGKTISLTDAESASISIAFADGLNLNVIAQTKSDAVAKDGASIINAAVMPILSDPSMAELGIGFIKDAVKISAAKKDLTANVKFSDSQMETLVGLLGGMMATAAPAPGKAKAAPKAAPAAAPAPKAAPAAAAPAKK